MRNARRFLVFGLIAAWLTSEAVWGNDHAHDAAPAPTAKAAPAPAHDEKTVDVAKHATHAPAPTATASVTPDDAIKMLADGNGRFVAHAARPNQSQQRLCDTFANGQHPYAAVLSCADSRVPVELVFDAGIGDLFVVRVAGNVADVDEIGTIEYGVEHLGINVVVVIGHTKCGAVTAVVEGAHVTPNIAKLVDNIAPAAEEARNASPKLTGPRLVGRAIKFNVRRGMADLVANSDLIRERVKSGKLKIVGGVYNLHSGEVEWLDEELPETTAKSGTPAPRATESPKSKDPHAKSTDKPADAPHAKDSHDGDSAAAHPENLEQAIAKIESPAPAKKENFVALGGMLAGSGVASFLLLQLISGLRG